MRKNRRLLFRILFLVIIVSLVLLFRQAILNYLVGPIASTIWLSWRVAASVEQSTYWSLIILLFLVFLIWIILFKKQNSTKTKYTDGSSVPTCRSLDYWHSRFTPGFHKPAGGEPLRRSMRNLLIDTLATVERASPKEIQDILENRTMPLPARIYWFLFPHNAQAEGKRPFYERILGTSNGYHNDIYEVLEWIETYLENKHEH